MSYINYIKYLLISLFDIWECYIYYFNSIMQISITKKFNTQLNTLESSTIYLNIPLYNFVNKINIVHPLYKVFHQWLCSYNTVVCRSVTFCNPQSSANKIKIEALVGILKWNGSLTWNMEVALVSGMEVVKVMTTGFQIRKNAKQNAWSHQVEVSLIPFFQIVNS